jgi:serine/threonine protein kinase
VHAGVGIGADLLVLVFAIFGFLFWYRKSLSTSPSPLQNPTHCQSFKGDTAAVKVMKGDVSNEIDILKMINNSNVIRLSGFCVHEVNTHLVYQFTENGSLADWLLSNNKYRSLAWKQIIQIAYDVADALNYLLNYTNPPYIQKNLKTSNILLDANLRAKLADFGLAITLENDQDGGFQSTRHDSGYSKLYGTLNTSKMESAPKLDVLASGVVMLELLSGKEAGRKQLQPLLKRVQVMSCSL